jgi:hypothetical protein
MSYETERKKQIQIEIDWLKAKLQGKLSEKQWKLKYSHKTFWQLLPNRCYVLGGLSALNLI